MFSINPKKLTPFDTQVLTLMELAPDHWLLGDAPRLVCHHKDLGWFHRHWIFGIQPLIPPGASNRLRSLSWRGQILMRRKLREIRRSAVDTGSPVEAVPPPGVLVAKNPTTFPPISSAPRSPSAHALAQLQAQQNAMLAQQVATTLDRNVSANVWSQRTPDYSAQAGALTAGSSPPLPPLPPPPPLRMQIADHHLHEMRAAGCDPNLLAAAVKGDARAIANVLKWIDQHM